MGTIGGIPVEEMKTAGLSHEDIEFIREKTTLYHAKISEPGRVSTTHDPASVIVIARQAFEAGMALGIAKSKRLTNVPKKLGF
jgi:hypothetical protein